MAMTVEQQDILRKIEINELSDLIEVIKDLKIFVTFANRGKFDPDVLPPMAEQFFLLASNHLNLALANLRLADYHSMQGK